MAEGQTLRSMTGKPAVRKFPRRSPTKSPHFAQAPKKPCKVRKKKLDPKVIVRPSSIYVPSTRLKSFGILQETLVHEPYRLLIAVILLNRTGGRRALPVFWQLLEKFPTAKSLAESKVENIEDIVRCLGLVTRRARCIKSLAHHFNNDMFDDLSSTSFCDPCISPDVTNGDNCATSKPERGILDIGSLAGVGSYALDSWRIFCAHVVGAATDHSCERHNSDFDSEPEWKKVTPTDKELRAYLRWMWLKEGWLWHPVTGQKNHASLKLQRQAARGNMTWAEFDSALDSMSVNNAQSVMSVRTAAIQRPRQCQSVEPPSIVFMERHRHVRARSV